MEMIAALFNTVARALRGLFDLGAMAFGVAPSGVALADAACVPMDSSDSPRIGRLGGQLDDAFEMSRAERDFYCIWG